MKMINKRFDFPRSNALVMGFCGIIIIAIIYYLAIYRPVSEGIANANAERDVLQIELKALQTKLGTLKNKQKKLKEIHLSGDSLGRIESYNNSKKEIDYLDEALKDTSTYSVNFSEVTRNRDLIRRIAEIQYRVPDYQQAKDVLSKLANCPYRCLLTEVAVSANRNAEDLTSGDVIVNMSITFFETLVDGETDTGLPPDDAEDEQ